MRQHILRNGTRYITYNMIYLVPLGDIWDSPNGTRYIMPDIWDNIIIWNSNHIEILYGDILYHKMGQDILCPLISGVLYTMSS